MFVPKIVYHSKIRKKKGRSTKSKLFSFVNRKRESSTDHHQQQEPSMVLDATSEVSSMFGDHEGLVVVDNPVLRETRKEEYTQLQKRVAQLERRNAELESLLLSLSEKKNDSLEASLSSTNNGKGSAAAAAAAASSVSMDGTNSKRG